MFQCFLLMLLSYQLLCYALSEFFVVLNMSLFAGAGCFDDRGICTKGGSCEAESFPHLPDSFAASNLHQADLRVKTFRDPDFDFIRFKAVAF